METLDVAKGDFSCLFKKTYSVFVTLILKHLLIYIYIFYILDGLFLSLYGAPLATC